MERIDIDMLLDLKNQLRVCIDQIRNISRVFSAGGSEYSNELVDQIDTERELLVHAERVIREIEVSVGPWVSGTKALISELIGSCVCVRKRLEERKSVLEVAGTNDHDVIPCGPAEPDMSFDELVSRMDVLYEALSSALTECVYAAPMSPAHFS